jgi:flagellin-like hook-associated protein FlgL
MADVNLSKAVRSNLLSLQSTAASMAKTQERLATGLKVNSALDNPSNFFTASALNSRASDMANLLDSMSSGIKTIEAADNGLKSITKTVESMQSTLRQARQDKSFKTQSFDVGSTDAKVTLQGGAVGTSAISVGGLASATSTTFGTAQAGNLTIKIGSGTAENVAVTGSPTAQAVVDAINGNAILKAGGVSAEVVDSKIVINNTSGQDVTLGESVAGVAASVGFTNNQTIAAPQGNVDKLVAGINSDARVNGAVRASNDNGKLRIENLSTSELTATVGSGSATTIGGNDVRKNLVKQFNELRDQLDKFADDASFNGINLLRGDKLKLTFNETGTSTIEIQAKDEGGSATSINSTALGIDAVSDADFDSDTAIDDKLDVLKGSLDSLRSQSSTFGSNLSVVENRQAFTKNMINTLQTGAANLTLADTNEEAANLLALQTRQQLSSTALSMASQADQAVLRLF